MERIIVLISDNLRNSIEPHFIFMVFEKMRSQKLRVVASLNVSFQTLRVPDYRSIHAAICCSPTRKWWRDDVIMPLSIFVGTIVSIFIKDLVLLGLSLIIISIIEALRRYRERRIFERCYKMLLTRFSKKRIEESSMSRIDRLIEEIVKVAVGITSKCRHRPCETISAGGYLYRVKIRKFGKTYSVYVKKLS